MAKIISPERLSNTLNEVIKEFDIKTKAKTERGIKKALIKTFAGIIKMTPVDEGMARGNWFIDLNATKEKGPADKNKGASYVSKRVPLRLLTTKLYLFNNLPYISKLEYGGYGPKDTEKTNTRGFSKLAGKGMVRVNLLKWRKHLGDSFKAL